MSWRRAGKSSGTGSLIILARVGLILYSATVLYWMFIGFGREMHMEGPLQYNLIRLRTISLYFDFSNGLSIISRFINLLGNIVVFIPFGILVPLAKTRPIPWIRITLYAVLCILLVECLQMLLHVGSFDVDDLLLNLIGVWAGYGLVTFISKK